MPLEDYSCPISYKDSKALKEESESAINSLNGDLELLEKLYHDLKKAKDLAFKLNFNSSTPVDSPVHNMGNDLTRMESAVCDIFRRFTTYKYNHDMDLRFSERRIAKYEREV